MCADNALDVCRHTAVFPMIKYYTTPHNNSILFPIIHTYMYMHHYSVYLCCKMNAKMLEGVDYS